MTELLRTVRRLLETDGGRLVLAGSALVALGVLGLLGSLLDAREAFTEPTLGSLERMILILVFSGPAAGVPFVVGVLLLTLARRRGAGLHPQAVPALWGATIAVAILGAAMAVAGVSAALMGSFGSGDGRLDLSAFRRLRALVEDGGGGLALAAAALAAGRAWAAGRDDVAAEASASDPTAVPTMAPHPLGASLSAPLGGAQVPASAAASAVPPTVPRHAGNGTTPGIDPELTRWGAQVPAEPPVPLPSPLDRRRSAYAEALRFSPRAGEARTLLDRLERNPDDSAAAAAFDALLGRGGR